MALGMGGDEGAFALATYHQIFGGQVVDRLAYGALADAKARSQVHFARNGLTGLPFSGLQTLQNQNLDLLVQRAGGGRWLPCRGGWQGRVIKGRRRDGVHGLQWYAVARCCESERAHHILYKT